MKSQMRIQKMFRFPFWQYFDQAHFESDWLNATHTILKIKVSQGGVTIANNNNMNKNTNNALPTSAGHFGPPSFKSSPPSQGAFKYNPNYAIKARSYFGL